MACEHAEWTAFRGGDVMEQLELVLGKVFGVGFEQEPPQPSVQLVELFGLRLVRHAVQYTSTWAGFVEE